MYEKILDLNEIQVRWCMSIGRECLPRVLFGVLKRNENDRSQSKRGQNSNGGRNEQSDEQPKDEVLILQCALGVVRRIVGQDRRVMIPTAMPALKMAMKEQPIHLLRSSHIVIESAIEGRIPSVIQEFSQMATSLTELRAESFKAEQKISTPESFPQDSFLRGLKPQAKAGGEA